MHPPPSPRLPPLDRPPKLGARGSESIMLALDNASFGVELAARIKGVEAQVRAEKAKTGDAGTSRTLRSLKRQLRDLRGELEEWEEDI